MNILVLVPFYRGAVVFQGKALKEVVKVMIVLVPFYRGAVVFNDIKIHYFQS